MPDRFGNPKVNVGLPDRTAQRRSASSLEINSKSIAELGATTSPAPKKVIRQFDRWEKAHKERVNEEIKRSMARDEYRRAQLRNREAEWEKQSQSKPKHHHHHRPASSAS